MRRTERVRYAIFFYQRWQSLERAVADAVVNER